MKDHIHSDPAQESKLKTRARSHPVSTRAYNKKDYEYISTFPRLAASAGLGASACHENVDLPRAYSDGKSDLFRTSSSVDYNTSVSSTCSTSSSTRSWAKDDTSLTDMESQRQYKSRSRRERPHHVKQHHHKCQYEEDEHQEHEHQQLSESSTLKSSIESMENPDLQKDNEEKSGIDSKSESNASEFELPNPTENGSVETKEAPIRLRSKVKSRHALAPAVLPKFGSWDTKNPSTGESYTLIFKRLRDEKKAGATPSCVSPTHPKAEEADVSLGLEIKAKEPLFPKSRGRNDPVRRTAKTQIVQGRMKWILCCKASVLGD